MIASYTDTLVGCQFEGSFRADIYVSRSIVTTEALGDLKQEKEKGIYTHIC